MSGKLERKASLAALSSDKKRDRPKRSESTMSPNSKRIAAASLRAGRVDDSSDSEHSARSPHRASLRLSPSANSVASARDSPRRIVALATQVEALDLFNPQPQLFGVPADLAVKHREFVSWARRLNYSYGPVEVLIVGPAGSGKSTLVETIVGEPCCPIGASTKRPVHYQLIDEPTARSIKYSVRDSQGELVCVNSEETAREIQRRSKRSTEPIVVQLEFSWGFDLTVIDTPGLRTPDDFDMWTKHNSASAPSRDSRLVHTNPHRFLVCVERCPTDKQLPPNSRVTDNLFMLPLLKRVDSALSNSICVLTGFDSYVESFCAQPQTVAASLSASASIPLVFCTLPTDEIRAACLTSGGSAGSVYKQRLSQYESIDKDSLQRWFDLGNIQSVIDANVGASALWRTILARVNSHVSTLVPDLSRAFADNIASLEQHTSTLAAIRSEWNVDKVRSFATQYSTLYLRFLESLVGGSTLGVPRTNGQTLRDEELEAGPWMSYEPMTPVSARAAASAPLRLYGAPQLFRLLDDFRSFAMKLEMPTVADTELSITSVDPAWTAAEIARSKVEQQFIPLMRQLLDRSFQVLKRVALVADTVADEHVVAGIASSQVARADRIANNKALTRGLVRTPSSISLASLPDVASPAVSSSHLKALPRRDSRLEPLHKHDAESTSQPSFDDLDILGEVVASTNVATLASAITLREFPAFASFLKQSYLFALSNLQNRCMQRCEDEFYGAHTLYWELTGGVDPLAMAGLPISERQAAVTKLVAKLYAEIKSRLIDGFVRNVQTYFLSQTSMLELMKSVLGDVSTLPDSSIVEMFKTDGITLALDRRIRSVSARVANLQAARTLFQSEVLPRLTVL